MFLNVKNLIKSYSKSKPIIKKLDFSVKKGEIISFIGESGSGKTTFLKCLRCWQFCEEIKHDGDICLRCKITVENNE